jgi:DNA-binding beta-propeller fold protein YncE
MKLRLVLSLAALAGANASGATDITTDQAADIVLGQTDFVSKVAPATPTAASMNTPGAVVVDPTTGKVFVADTSNNRVLRFDSVAAMTSGASAEAVLGQPDLVSNGSATTQKEMDSPFGLAIDKNGTLWVADSSNNRVLRFDAASAKANFAVNADGVLGQPNFSTKTVLTPPTQASMSSPRAVAVDGNGTLWVADFANNRVLRFDDAANAINGANADGVLGAPNFLVNYGGATTQYAFHGPDGLAVDPAGHLWVADYSNNRVLRFDDAANRKDGALADRVLGQPDFTTSLALSTPTAASLNHPAGLAVNSKGALWVSDALNSRILRFDAAAKKGDSPNANAVLGQVDFVTKGSTVTATGISAAFGIAFDAAGALWVADTLNHRVLHYTPHAISGGSKSPAAIAITVSGKRKLATTAAKVLLKGTAACADGVARVEYRVGKKGGFKTASGGAAWSIRAKVPPGTNKILVRAVSAKGLVSASIVIKVTRH